MIQRLICWFRGHRYVSRKGPQFIGAFPVTCSYCGDWHLQLDPPITIPPHSEAVISVDIEVVS